MRAGGAGGGWQSRISRTFEAIPHDWLMTAIQERVSDRHLLKLLRAMLRAGAMQNGAISRNATGTPQGGMISPALPTSTCTGSTGRWRTQGCGVLVRYADDLW